MKKTEEGGVGQQCFDHAIDAKPEDVLRILGSDITKIAFINFIYLSFVFVLDSGNFNNRYKEA
jgi:hypothetical protein